MNRTEQIAERLKDARAAAKDAERELAEAKKATDHKTPEGKDRIQSAEVALEDAQAAVEAQQDQKKQRAEGLKKHADWKKGAKQAMDDYLVTSKAEQAKRSRVARSRR